MKSGYQLAQQEKQNKDKPFDWATQEYKKKTQKPEEPIDNNYRDTRAI